MWCRRVHVSFAWLAALCVALAVVAAQGRQPDQAFRCLRAFSMIDSMGTLTKVSAEENCRTPYFDVTNATVDVRCGAEGETTCRAALNVVLRVAEDVTERVSVALGNPGDFFTDESRRSAWLRDIMADMPTDSTDPWRYAYTLRSLDAGTSVNYKGFDGNGFSMCCDMLTPPAEAESPLCGHITGALGDNDVEEDAGGQIASPFQVVHHCPLPVLNAKLTDGTAGKRVHGHIEKPLHVLRAGAWEARLDLWRRRGDWQSDDNEDSDEDEERAHSAPSDSVEGAEGDREALLRVVVRFHVDETMWSAAAKDTAAVHLKTSDNGVMQLADEDL